MFIERPADPSPAGAQTLAARVAARFGVPESMIAGRVEKGRFRVKAGVDLEKARRFAIELEKLGAVCSIADDAGRSVPIAEPAPADEFLTLEPPPEPVGLSAAAGAGPQDLGALGASGGPDGLRLSALDGSGPAAAAAAGSAKTPGADAFLPPEMLEERSLELLTPAPELTPPPPPSPPEVSAASAPIASEPIADAPPVAARERSHPLEVLAERPRLRLGVGAALAVLLGFLAAHLAASLRESGYADIRRDVIEAQAEVVSEDQWNALDGIRAAALERLDARKTNAIITALAVWVLVGGGVVFAWQRAIDWSRWTARDGATEAGADLG